MMRIFLCAVMALSCATLNGNAATLSGTVRLNAAPGVTGASVEDVHVLLFKLVRKGNGDDSIHSALGERTTDAQGAFSFTRLDTGRVMLSALKEGYEPEEKVVSLPQDTGHYIAGILFPDTTPGRLKVTVLEGSEHGKGLAGATIVLMRKAASADTVKADANGEYTFTDLLPGIHTVKVRAEGFQWINRLPDYVNVTVYPRYTTTERIVLWPANASGSIAGKAVKVSDGSAVSGAKISVSRSADSGNALILDTVITGSDGAYRIENLPAWKAYSVMAQADGYQTVVTYDFSVDYRQAFKADFLLLPATASDSRMGSVTGVVTDSARNGLAGAFIKLDSGWSKAEGQPTLTVESDGQGRFVFPKVNRGQYRITASRAGYGTEEKSFLAVYIGQSVGAYMTLRKTPILGMAAKSSTGMRLYAGPAGRMVLEVPVMPVAGRVRVYDVRGALRFFKGLPAGASRLDIPWARGRPGYVVFERGGKFRRWAAPAMP
jgi:hypothetical protein